MIDDKQRAAIAAAAASGKMAPGGQQLSRFNPRRLAAALEVEANRALVLGAAEGTPGKVDIYLDPRDALALARFLRSGGA